MRGGEWGWLDPALVRLIDQPATALLLQVLALLIAAGVGAVHALGPGHGKTLVGAYFAGQPGRARDAVGLGVVVALMHCGSVLVLAVVLHRMQRYPLGDSLGPALGVLTGAAVATLGMVMLWRQRAAQKTRPPAPIASSHGAVHPPHAGHHHHVPPGVAPLSRAGIAALATTGGLLPSPAAFLLLTTALAMGRAGYGLTLVAAFSVGMAVTLAAVGLGAMSGRQLLVRKATRRGGLERVARLTPRLSAIALLVGGTLVAGGALRSWWLL